MIKKFIQFITTDIWQKKESEFTNPKVRWALRPFKIIIYTIRGMDEHSMAVRSAALTFFTLMSIVPVAALIFGVVKGFGLEANFNEYLYAQFPQYTSLIDMILEFANNMLQRTKGGIVASVGFVVLFWAVMQVFGNIEKAFNNIWEIKKQRSLARKFSDYVSVVVVAPILMVVSNSLALYVRSSLSTFSGQWLVDILFSVVSLVAVWMLFAFIYYVMPNTRVKIKGALIAGIIAGTSFAVFQVGYFYIQSQLNTYNVVYGSFAALPLFLLWLQLSWMILLFGAELSFAYQNIAKYEQEREALHMCYDHRRKVMVAAMVVIAKHFLNDKGSVKSEVVAEELNLPVRIIRDVIFDLENAGLIVSVKMDDDDKVNYYIPGRDLHAVTVFDVIYSVEGSSSAVINVDISGNSIIDEVSKVLDGVKKGAYESSLNICLTELISLEEQNVETSNVVL